MDKVQVALFWMGASRGRLGPSSSLAGPAQPWKTCPLATRGFFGRACRHGAPADSDKETPGVARGAATSPRVMSRWGELMTFEQWIEVLGDLDGYIARGGQLLDLEIMDPVQLPQPCLTRLIDCATTVPPRQIMTP